MVFEVLQGLGLDAIEPALRVHRGLDDPRLAQHPQVLGHGRLRHAQPALELAHRLLRVEQQAEDRAPVRLRDDRENAVHGVNIPKHVYTCQGI